jgi:hypothetical protein
VVYETFGPTRISATRRAVTPFEQPRYRYLSIFIPFRTVDIYVTRTGLNAPPGPDSRRTEMTDPEGIDPEVVLHSDDAEDGPCVAGHSGNCNTDLAE